VQNPTKTLTELETKFWQSMVDQDTETAVEMLSEPSLMVNTHGSMKFDHATFRKMAQQDALVLTDFDLSDVEVVFPNDSTALVTYHAKQTMAPKGKSEKTVLEMNDTSTWIRVGDGWKCVMHTETPAQAKPAQH